MSKLPGTMMESVSQTEEVIAAASKHDLRSLQRCINEMSFEECKVVDVQDLSTGYTPLHAAIASLGITGPFGDPDATEQGSKEAKVASHETIQFLLENGAIWNQLDRNHETPGCIAKRLGLESLYQLMVDAGVRAEMLLNRLDEYDEIQDLDEGEEEKEEGGRALETNEHGSSSGSKTKQLNDVETKDEAEAEASAVDHAKPNNVSSSAYLSSALSHHDHKLLDSEQNGVMMAWEKDIMSQSADAILPSPQLNVLNVGFGMGIIDTFTHDHLNTPLAHHIIEAHPDVLQDMRAKGWMDKPGVVVHEGKWQEICPKLIDQGHSFDGIYYDTFAESYHDFKEFFSEYVLELLEPSGRWSFFNGMGADRQISYDVYQNIVELDLFEAGFDVEWTPVELPDLGSEWEGVKRKYWNVESYRLPVCKFMD